LEGGGTNKRRKLIGHRHTVVQHGTVIKQTCRLMPN
jgi:hypothetical protein